MNSQWKEYERKLRSGDPDHVNPVVNEIKDLSVLERADLFDDCFEEVTDLYASHDDGIFGRPVSGSLSNLPQSSRRPSISSRQMWRARRLIPCTTRPMPSVAFSSKR